MRRITLVCPCIIARYPRPIPDESANFRCQVKGSTALSFGEKQLPAARSFSYVFDRDCHKMEEADISTQSSQMANTRKERGKKKDGEGDGDGGGILTRLSRRCHQCRRRRSSAGEGRSGLRSDGGPWLGRPRFSRLLHVRRVRYRPALQSIWEWTRCINNSGGPPGG